MIDRLASSMVYCCHRNIGDHALKLTEQEKSMLRGEMGEGTRIAMEIVVQFGELYGAERLLPISNAHIDAAAYTTVWEAGSDFIEFLADHGAKTAVPTTINPVSRDIENWKKLGISEGFAKKSRRLEEAYLRMGVIPTWTCAPYQAGNVPKFGEVVGWSESNAVNFVNSAIGARSERLPDLADVCCAVVGRVPEFGMYLEENRLGDILFSLQGFDDTWFWDSLDYALLGYFVGETAVNRVPVVEGLPKTAGVDDVKAFSAAAASGGAVCRFHLIGITPGSDTPAMAFGKKTAHETVIVRPQHLLETRKKLSTAAGTAADMVLLGCPHANCEELVRTAELIRGKKVSEHVDLWIMTGRVQYQLAAERGAIRILEEAGAVILRDTCLMEMDEGTGRWAGKTVVTNSGKAAQYAPAINGVRIIMATLRECVAAAVSGIFTEEHCHGDQ